jgi:hypothetical protein
MGSQYRLLADHWMEKLNPFNDIMNGGRLHFSYSRVGLKGRENCSFLPCTLLTVFMEIEKWFLELMWTFF